MKIQPQIAVTLNSEGKTLADVFRFAGNGTKAYSLRHGNVTYAGHKTADGATVLLFMTKAGIVGYTADGAPAGEAAPDLLPYENGKFAEWLSFCNLLAFQERILSEEFPDKESFDHFVARNASYMAYARRTAGERPNQLGGRLMKAFSDAMDRKLDDGRKQFPAKKAGRKKHVHAVK